MQRKTNSRATETYFKALLMQFFIWLARKAAHSAAQMHAGIGLWTGQAVNHFS
jgi:hypothetical protein